MIAYVTRSNGRKRMEEKDILEILAEFQKLKKNQEMLIFRIKVRIIYIGVKVMVRFIKIF